MGAQVSVLCAARVSVIMVCVWSSAFHSHVSLTALSPFVISSLSVSCVVSL